MKTSPRAHAIRLLLVAVCALLLFACDEDDAKKKREAEAQRQLQAQLEEEQAQRRRAEQAVLAAEQSNHTKIIAVVAGSCIVVFLVGLAGIAIGSRAHRRSGKEVKDG
jgi:hypothetical protein